MISSVMNTAFGGMEVASRQLHQAAVRTANPETSLKTIERDHVDMSVSKATYQANAAVVQTGDEMLGSLLDIVA
jgi:flagellar hook protein FlgE